MITAQGVRELTGDKRSKALSLGAWEASVVGLCVPVPWGLRTLCPGPMQRFGWLQTVSPLPRALPWAVESPAGPGEPSRGTGNTHSRPGHIHTRCYHSDSVILRSHSWPVYTVLWDLSPVKGLHDRCNDTQTAGLPAGSLTRYLRMYLHHALMQKPHRPSLHGPSPPALPIIFLTPCKATLKYTHTGSFLLLNLPRSRNCTSRKSNLRCVSYGGEGRGVTARRMGFCPVVCSCRVLFSLCSTICQICKILFTFFFPSLHQRAAL